MPNTYTIKKGWVLGYKRWLVVCSDPANSRHFGLKRHAVQYVLDQEQKERKEKQGAE